MLAERQAAATFMAAGAKKVQLPDLDGAWADFDAALNSGDDSSRSTPEVAALRKALGV